MYVYSWMLVTSVTTTTPYMSNLLASPLEVKITQATCTIDVHLLCIVLYHCVSTAGTSMEPKWPVLSSTVAVCEQKYTLLLSHRLSRCGCFQHQWHYLLNSIPWRWIEVSKDPPGSGERSLVPWQWEQSWQVSSEDCYFHPTNRLHGIPIRISFPCPKCGLGLLFRYRKWGIVAHLLFLLQLSLSLTL